MSGDASKEHEFFLHTLSFYINPIGNNFFAW